MKFPKGEIVKKGDTYYKKTLKTEWVRLEKITCVICGQEWLTKHPKSQTCSPKCRAKFRWGKTPYEEGKRWRKSRVHRKGYSYIRIPGQPGEFLEHRVVMEKILKRRLNKNEFVHHINGNPGDNRPVNLIVITKGGHNSIHKKEEVKNRKRNNEGQFS